MAITDPLVLAADVELVSVDDLPVDLREQMGCEDGDYVITRQRSRTPSRLVDAQAAELLKEFRIPKTIVKAVMSYSQMRKADPEQTLDQAFPMIQHFLDSRLLVSAHSKEAGQIVPSFEVGDQVAGCEVLRCVQVLEDTELYQVRRASGEFSALKVLRLSSSEKMQRTLDREVAILKHLNSSVNPALLEVGTFAGQRYLVLEWCSGVDASVIAGEFRKHPNAHGYQNLLHLSCAILEAFSRLHAQQVIHSDIHPRNVLVASDGSVKIIDYGLARMDSNESGVDEQPRGGVAFFFEPEYAEASLAGRKPPKSSMLGEQYALAAMLYFLFTGTHYLDFSLEKYEMLRQIAEDHPLPFSQRGVTPWPDLEKLLAKGLRKNPSDRFPSIAAFLSKLNEVTVPDGQSNPIVARDATLAEEKAAEELLNTVLQRVGLKGPLLFSGLTTSPTSSVNFGAAGIAYALYRIACVWSDAPLLSLADIWATKAIHDSKHKTAFYNSERDIDITPETVGQISPYHTASGLHCVQALISHAMGDVASQQRAIEAFISASMAPCESLDLTLGRSGTLLACSLLLDTNPESSVLDTTRLLDLGNEVMRDVWEKVNTSRPIRECPGTLLGMAHGWAGILYATMRWCLSSGKILPRTLGERLQQLAECAEPISQGVHWKVRLQMQSSGHGDNYMVGWCHGSAGYVHLWTLAHQMLGNEAYLALAEKAAWNAWESPETLSTLCCGLAGRAYSLLNLYKYTRERKWLHRAQKLANQAAVSIKALARCSASPDKALNAYPNSLYRGEVGVAVLAAEVSMPEASCMPFFEQEGWPASASSMRQQRVMLQKGQ